MPATISASDLVALVNRVGFQLTETTDDETARIYVWSDCDDSVLYIGKADGQTPARRHRDEAAWTSEDPHDQNRLMSGIVYLVARNRASVRYYNVEVDQEGAVAYAPQRAEALFERNGWAHDAPYATEVAAAARQGWSVRQIEHLLIRVCVRLGVAVGNASGTGLWEDACGTPTDVLAALLSDDIAACTQGPGQTDIAPRSSHQARELRSVRHDIADDVTALDPI